MIKKIALAAVCALGVTAPAFAAVIQIDGAIDNRMCAVDLNGGGEGRTSGGRHPVTPWGKPTKGKRTCSNKKTDRLIMRRRHAKK